MSAKLDALTAAAERFGDLRAHHEAQLRGWERGAVRPDFKIDECREAEFALISAARAFATSTRKKRKP